jgi:uncharacterized protein (DUF3084 family)
MPEEISTQILSQASENIQKLFDLSTRIDERVKNIQNQHESLERRAEEIVRRQQEILQKTAVLESKETNKDLVAVKLDECEEAIIDIDKRISMLESENNRYGDRWNRIATFVIQLVWVILAAYLLTKLHLQAPAVP